MRGRPKVKDLTEEQKARIIRAYEKLQSLHAVRNLLGYNEDKIKETLKGRTKKLKDYYY